VAELLDDLAEPQVIRAEVVPPRGDAVRLVDHEQRRLTRPDLL
jgi:hypothetical protein